MRELWSQSEGQPRCPYIAADDHSCFCKKDHPNFGCSAETINESRRIVCDTASLQLWCLDGERYHLCMIYQGK